MNETFLSMNLTQATGSGNVTSGGSNSSGNGCSGVSVNDLQGVIEIYVIPAICLFGILGNVLNIIVLSQRRLHLSMGPVESSVHTGLLALSVSDMLFCVTVLPHAFSGGVCFYYDTVEFWLVYYTYANVVINTGLLCSAWITVVLAVCRYLAVCSPLQTFHGRTLSLGKMVALVCLCCVLANVPRCIGEYITTHTTEEGDIKYYSMKTAWWKGAPEMSYKCIYFVLAIIVPVIILTYCTACLIWALKKSRRLRQRHSNAGDRANSGNVVTITLCTIVILYVILVIPAELMTFATYFMPNSTFGPVHAVCNALQAINFSGNFLLYCVINVHFRQAAHDVVAQLVTGRSCTKSAGENTNNTEHIPLRNKPIVL